MGSDDSEVIDFSSSSNDEGSGNNDVDIDGCLDPSGSCTVDESSKSFNISFENLVDDDLVDELRIIEFHDPCDEGYWLEFGEPCYATSSMKSESVLDDDLSDVDSVSTLSMLSLHPLEDTINEPNPFPSVGANLFEINMLEENFSFPSLDSFHSLEAVDESFPNQELSLVEPKWDDDICDSTRTVLIDPYEINLEKTIEEDHPMSNNLLGFVCEGNGQPLEFNEFSFDLNSGESLPFVSESRLQFLPKFSSPSFESNIEFYSKYSSSF